MKMEERENEKKGGGVKRFRSYSLLWERRYWSLQLIGLFVVSCLDFTVFGNANCMNNCMLFSNAISGQEEVT